MDYNSIEISNKYKLFSEQWQPKVIAEMNDYQFKSQKLKVNSFGIVIKKLTRLL